MPSLAIRLRDCFYDNDACIYRAFDLRFAAHLPGREGSLLDAGFGNLVLVLHRSFGKVKRLMNAESVDFADEPHGTETCSADLGRLPMPTGRFAIVMSRRVFDRKLIARSGARIRGTLQQPVRAA